jgi:hypothetical protein
VDAWVFIWLILILKIPILALFLIVRWAVRQTPETVPEQDGGVGRPRPPHPRSPLPRSPRRGPHGDPAIPSPPRVRTVTVARRLPHTGRRLARR